MVVREDGSKWACTSCLKGHRVSGCNHVDRELHLVPKKGRPVTQCQHCRQERKKRSAHVSCDCAAPDKPHHSKEKCIHLREAEERAKNAGFYDENNTEIKDVVQLASVAEEQGCCCSHGGKCTCALLRKDSSDYDGMPQGPAVCKPKLEATRSDGSLTVFANGHHKPVHRKNHAAHECGMPYKMPLSRSKTDQTVSMAARRSMDSLATIDTQFNAQSFKIPAGLSRSGGTSPSRLQAHLFANAEGFTSDKYSLIDFSDLDRVQTNESAPSTVGDGKYTPFEMSTLLESPFDEWAGLNPGMPNTTFSAWPTADASLVQPALTAASSGTQSEIDEIPSIDDVYAHGMPSIQELNFVDLNNPLLTNSPQSNRRSLPPGFFGNIDFSAATPNAEDDWQAQLGDSNGMVTEKPMNGVVFSDPWQGALQNNERRNLTAPYPTGRPVAKSVGPGSAPSADIMRQLFPDMDVDINANTNMQARARTQGMSNSISISDEDEIYMAQAWTDGSMSVPVDDFGMEEGFDGQDFNVRGWN